MINCLYLGKVCCSVLSTLSHYAYVLDYLDEYNAQVALRVHRDFRCKHFT